MIKSYAEIIKEINISDLSEYTKNTLKKYTYCNFNKSKSYKKYEKFTSNEDILKQSIELGEKIGLIYKGKINENFLKRCIGLSTYNVSKVKTVVNKLYDNYYELNKNEKALIKNIENLNLINKNQEFEYDKNIVKFILIEIVKMFKIYNYKQNTILLKNKLKPSDNKVLNAVCK